MAPTFDRKEALRAFKERKIRSGIYAIRNTVTGRAWAGSANDLDATRNGQWNTLNSGRHLEKELQAQWRQFGEDAFEYVILEVLECDPSPLVQKETLKAKKAEWAKKLG